MGSFRRKIDPRLQLLVDAEADANEQRLERGRERSVGLDFFQNSPAQLRHTNMEHPRSLGLRRKPGPEREGGMAVPGGLGLGEEGSPPARVDALVPADSVRARETVNVFIAMNEETAEPEIREAHLSSLAAEAVQSLITGDDGELEITGRRGSLASARVAVEDLPALAEDAQVAYFEHAEVLSPPDPRVDEQDDSGPTHAGRRLEVPLRDGRPEEGPHEVLIGIVDVGGFDFAHKDFLKGDRTRLHSIWDQGGEIHPPPDGVDYGSLITAEHMNAALEHVRNNPNGLPACLLEPQSQAFVGSHGTHVASIAAGNSGICPGALIAGVLIHPERDVLEDRRLSFYDSTRLAHAVEHLIRIAQLRQCPVSINISLGTNGHAHDGSSAVSRWFEHALAVPGRSICVAAGNAGQEGPESEDDLGWMMGRIHTSGRIPARDLVRDVEWLVVGDGFEDMSENELEIWYGAQDRLEVRVRPPGADWSEWVEPGRFIKNRRLDDRSCFSVYNQLYQQANGLNTIAIYLSPEMAEGGRGVKAGLWTVRLRGVEIRDGRYHGWIERDDPGPAVAQVGRPRWRYPSFFSKDSNVDESSVNSLACGERVISVANLDGLRERINITSSQGPTRDGRNKPDVAAPGTKIAAARGFNQIVGDPHNLWITMSGTSMASPYVAGVIGLMLSVEPTLTAAQIGGIIRRTARPLPGADFSWQNDAGFGVVDARACIKEAVNANRMEELIEDGGGR